jgi:hypothetical protein
MYTDGIEAQNSILYPNTLCNKQCRYRPFSPTLRTDAWLSAVTLLMKFQNRHKRINFERPSGATSTTPVACKLRVARVEYSVGTIPRSLSDFSILHSLSEWLKGEKKNPTPPSFGSLSTRLKWRRNTPPLTSSFRSTPCRRIPMGKSLLGEGLAPHQKYN